MASSVILCMAGTRRVLVLDNEGLLMSDSTVVLVKLPACGIHLYLLQCVPSSEARPCFTEGALWRFVRAGTVQTIAVHFNIMSEELMK